jgi:uncharacterized membrane protein YgcG
MNVLVVASAGNSGGPVSTPGNCTGVVAVAGLREDGTKVGFSNLGPGVALSAPAGNCVNTSGACLYSIDTTYNVGLTTPQANSYTNQTNTNLGTSFSAPLVSGIAGLMLSVNANLTPAQLAARLESSAALVPFPVSSNTATPTCQVPASSSDFSQNVECNCTTATCGAGMANALAAVTAALAPIAAVAVPSSGYAAGSNVVLNAAGSAAACHAAISSYAWTIPGGGGTIVSGASSNAVTVVAPSGANSFTVQLTVTDNSHPGKTDTASVVVNATSATTSAPASAGSTPCLAPITPAAPSYVAVTPSGPSVQAGLGTQQFAANVVNAGGNGVSWEVNGVAGGNSTTGTISPTGLYTAPASIPSSPTVTVTAVSTSNASLSGFAGVTLTAPPSLSVSPSSASVLKAGGTQSFTATVSNVTNTAVTWQVNGITGGNATLGTISNTGLYTAPAVIPSPATVTVIAVSTADPALSGSAIVTVVHVVVGVIPATATVGASQTQSFTATVTNTANTAVTWQVNGIAGGNASVGTISSAGLYTAPAVIPSLPTETISAVSAADPTQSGSATVTIAHVAVSILPTVVALPTSGAQSFVATVLNTTNTAVTWQVNGITGGNATVGTVSTSGVYTAPALVPTPPTVSVTAVSVADATESATASATIQVASTSSSSGGSSSSSSGGSSSGSSSGSSTSSGGGGSHGGGGAMDLWSLLALSGALLARRRGGRVH